MCTPWGSDRVELVPDWAGLRRFSGGSALFAGVRMQFESHLGHGMTPPQRGFCFNVWTLTLRESFCQWPRSVPSASVAYEVVWVAGSGSWLVGPPPAGMWGHTGLLSGLLRRPWLVFTYSWLGVVVLT
jgi:hypothetical protein